MAKKFQNSRVHRTSLQDIFNKIILVTTAYFYVATDDLKFKSKNINMKVSKSSVSLLRTFSPQNKMQI